jgi:hypothetical protein
MHLPLSLRKVAALVNPDSESPFGPDDFGAIDFDADQVHSEDGQLFILAFVSNDGPVTFRTSAGLFDFTSLWGDEGNEWVCDDEDEDCDGDGLRGDGVAVAWFWSCGDGNPVARTCFARSKLGSETVTVRQGTRTTDLDFVVVGEPHDVEVVAVENTIQAGLDADACPLETTTEGFAEALGLPEKTVILARALDSEDTQVTGAFVDWKTDDRHKGVTASALTPTLDLGDLGIGTANVLCGTDETGSTTVTARIIPLTARVDGSFCYESAECPFELDPMANTDRKSVRYTVVGPPADLRIAAEPAALVCDGTAGSTVSATVIDAEGNPVANGNEVHFEVKVLGAATPGIARTADGVAVASVTPLSGILQGVPVVVTAGEVQESVLISCEGAVSPAPSSSIQPTPPVASSTPSGRILPPSTGSAGCGG